MKTFLQLYRWSMQMKLHMAMYTFIVLFLKAICNLALGEPAVLSIDLLTIWLTCLVFAIVESAIFPENSDRTAVRTALWFLAANVLFLAGAFLFQWFAGVPLWGILILIFIMELSLVLMWFGDQFVLKLDSADLTKQLKTYQRDHT